MRTNRIILKNLLYLLLFISLFSCETDDNLNTDERGQEQEEVDHSLEEITINLPEVLFTEADKIAAGDPSLTIMNRMIDLVDATPSGETIHISVYSFHDFPQFVNALKSADNRGVSINIMIDLSTHDQNHVDNNRTYMEELNDLPNINFVGVNNTAGAIAINHNKFMLISKIEAEGGTISNIVHQSSHNFTEYDTRRLQDAVTLSNEGLYNAYRDYYNDTRQLAGEGMENYQYREYEENGLSAFFYPRRNGGQIGDDNIINLLDDITDPTSTSIKIGMSGWSPSRISILRKLEELHSEGATVEIVTKSNIAISLQEELRMFAMDGAFVKIYDDINIHSKFMIIEGNWQNEQTNLVLMGSQNFTNNAYKYNNETSLLFQDHQFFEAYRDYFEEIKVLPGLCCIGEDEREEDEENPNMTYLVTEDFDTYNLAGGGTDLNGLGNTSSGWGDSWEKHSGSFLLQEGNLPTDDNNGGKHAITSTVDENINYYRSLAENWGNIEGNTYWLGFYVNPEQPASWSGLGLYKDDTSLALIGTPYNSEQQGVAGMQGSNLTIDGSTSSDQTWFVAKMEMSGAGGTPHFYLWRNPNPNTEPDTATADLDFLWPDGREGFNRIRVGNNWRNNASIGYDHIRLSKNYQDIVFQN